MEQNNQNYSNDTQQYVPVDQNMNYNPYKPRFISYFTMFLAGIGGVSLILFAILKLFTEYLTVDTIVNLLQPFIVYETPLLVIGIISLIAAIAFEIYSRIKTPPAAFRVKNELVRTLSQFGLVDIHNTNNWKGMFAVSPVGKFNKNAQSYTISFLLRHANARQALEKIEDAISGFARCQSAEIKEDNSKKLWNYQLILWYTDNPYGEVDLEDDLFGE